MVNIGGNMKIGLYNLEPKINNSAMMQVSYYHKSLGDDVEIYKQSNHDDYDKIYAFSIFDFTDKSTPEEDMYRVMHLVDKYKISPFVMPYNKFDPYQKKFARWVNNKIIFNKVAWEDFEN